MSVALCMIVRDSGEQIARCLDSTRRWIDKLIVIDTGSMDGTPRRIGEWAAENDVELELEYRPWVGFGHNRTELMKLARGKADWLILLDDDLVLHLDEWPAELADWNLGNVGDPADESMDYKLPLIVSGSKPWHFVGAAHCYLDSTELFTEKTIPGLWVEDHSEVSTEKMEADVQALSVALVEDPLDSRSAFYLARSYEDLGRVSEAIHFYRMVAEMGGWAEQTYYARFRLGVLLSSHVSFAQGAPYLLQAWQERPDRAESLRALGEISHAVADKIPYPAEDWLFVSPACYRRPEVTPDEISAVIVTRGNVDLDPVLEVLPYDEVVVWDNSKRPDRKIFGRYCAAKEAKHDVIFSVDDDVIFRRHVELMHEYEPGRVLANMDDAWRRGTGYDKAEVCMVGAGALWDRRLAFDIFDRYLTVHPADDDFYTESDFIFGAMAPYKIVDLGYETRDFADDPDRLYQQPGQTERKWAMIERVKALAGVTEP